MRSGTAKDALARLKWKEQVPDWTKVFVTIRHHGAPNDRKSVSGDRITGLGTSFFELDGETHIPYHRILRIEWDLKPVYERPSSSVIKD